MYDEFQSNRISDRDRKILTVGYNKMLNMFFTKVAYFYRYIGIFNNLANNKIASCGVNRCGLQLTHVALIPCKCLQSLRRKNETGYKL